MAKINFNDYQKVQEQASGTDIGYFNLKNDGDEAIVRIMHDSVDDFDIVSAHSVQIGNRYHDVECLRTPNDPVSVCPLCNSGSKFSYKFYVHMIQYITDAQGNVTAKPVVWSRGAKGMSQKLVTMIQEYGPLSDCIFKIRRNGEAGNLKTTYEILFANPAVYRAELYPKIEGVFDNYTVCGRQVSSKTAEDMTYYLNNGTFPAKDNGDSSRANNQTTDNNNANVQTPPTSAPTQTVNTAPGVAQRMPWESAPANPANNGGRPVRYY